MVHVVVVMCLPLCLRFDRGVVHFVVAGDIVDHSSLFLTDEWFILLWLFIMLTIIV